VQASASFWGAFPPKPVAGGYEKPRCEVQLDQGCGSPVPGGSFQRRVMVEGGSEGAGDGRRSAGSCVDGAESDPPFGISSPRPSARASDRSAVHEVGSRARCGLPSSRKMRSYWRESSAGLRR